MGYTIGIDFDGTVVTHEYPRVGRDIGAVPVLKRLVKCGNRLILFTMRSRQNGTLQDAVNWFEENGIKLYGVNTNPTQSEWTDSPKAHCHIYIDDAALGIPKKFDMETMRMYVDWGKVEELLEEEGAFDNYYDEEDENNVNEIKKKMKITEAQLRRIIQEAISNLPSYEDWRTEVESETMWRQHSGMRNVWRAKGNIIFDSSGHATGHLGYSLLQKVLNLVDFSKVDERGFISQTVEFSKPIGYQECVQTTDNDNIIYAQRPNRRNVSRFALGREPEPCNTVFIVLRAIKGTINKWQIITAYVGTKSGLEPWDKRAKQEDQEFWKNHALVSPYYTEDDNVGDETYWKQIAEAKMKRNMKKINETQLRKIVSESIKRILSEETDYKQQLIKRFYESDWETEFVDRVDTYCNEYNIWAEDDGIEFYGSGEGSCEDDIEIYMLSCKLPDGTEVNLINNY